MEMPLGAQVTKEDDILSLAARAYRVQFGFLEDMDQVSGLMEFTNLSSKSMMTAAKGRHAEIIVGEARILSPTAFGKDGMFDTLSHGWLQLDRHNESKKSKGEAKEILATVTGTCRIRGRWAVMVSVI